MENLNEEVHKALNNEGGIILYPTDTVWVLVVMRQMPTLLPKYTN
jgi:tRNA A37 threonylcarbamoyladenosine synthetase subunit TsaC/SUA5/YrdC